MWECSHIGGDRFAANLLLLPESLYFGRCDGAAAERVLAAYDAGRIDLAWFRGRSTLNLVEQAAEHFVRTEFALDTLDAIVDRVDRRRAGGRRARRRRPGDKTVVVTVEKARRPAPTPLTCKGAEG